MPSFFFSSEDINQFSSEFDPAGRGGAAGREDPPGRGVPDIREDPANREEEEASEEDGGEISADTNSGTVKNRGETYTEKE